MNIIRCTWAPQVPPKGGSKTQNGQFSV